MVSHQSNRNPNLNDIQLFSSSVQQLISSVSSLWMSYIQTILCWQVSPPVSILFCNLSFSFRNFRTISFCEVKRVWGILHFVMYFLYVFWSEELFEKIFPLSLWVFQMTYKVIGQVHFSELANIETPFTQMFQEESP